MRAEDLQVAPGDSLVLTPAASASVMDASGTVSDEILIALVIEELAPWEEGGERVWGALVNGQLHQILSSEIDHVIRAST